MIEMLVSNQLRLVIQAVGLVVLARLLAPEAFGVFAIAIAVFLAIEGICEFGLGSFLIKTERLENSTVQSAFGLSIVLSAVGYALLVAGGLALPPSIMPPATGWTLLVLAQSLLVLPIIVILRALLQRELRFTLLASLSVVAITIQFVVIASLAWLGLGSIALACGFLVEKLFVAAVLLALARPVLRLQPRCRSWGVFVDFARFYVPTKLLPNLCDALMLLGIGRLLGVTHVGLFNRAQTIVQLADRSIFDSIGPVVLPIFRQALERGEPAAALFMAKTDRLCAICWPIFGAIGILAEPLVLVLLGGQWVDAIPIVRVLAWTGLALPFLKMNMKLFVAIDRVDRYFRIQLGYHAGRLVAALGGSLVSLEAVCWGLVLAGLGKAAVVLRVLVAEIAFSWRALVVVMARAAVIAACTAAGPAAVVISSTVEAPLPVVAIGITLAALGWLAGSAATRHVLLRDILHALAAIYSAGIASRRQATSHH